MRAFHLTGAFVLFLSLTVAFQVIKGGYSAEFGETSDESAHYITGLMVRDYVASGFPWPPMEYAENYYVHYPKVALGHYPPVFYVLEAAWMLLFGPSRVSVLLLLGTLTALFATILCEVVR